jgi:uncharacterized protein (TIGR03067 family)
MSNLLEMKTNLLTVLAVTTLSFLCGCASPAKRELSRFQGNWVGQEIGGPTGECRVTVAGDTLKFQGARSEEWYVARLIFQAGTNPNQADVLIQDCPVPRYIGKTAKGIYRFEGKTLTIAANEPGDESRPTGIDRNATSRARVFVFTRQ